MPITQGMTNNDLPIERMKLNHGYFILNPPANERDLHVERMRAALPTLGPGSYFCRESASLLHGLPLWYENLRLVHVVRTQGGHGGVSPWIHAYTTPKNLPKTTEIDGLRITSLERTAADVMRTLKFGPSLALADAVLRLGGSRGLLLKEVESGRGCRHCQEAVMRADPRSESPYESWARAIMLQNQIPLPKLQHEFFDSAGFAGRVDFHWPRFRLVGEYDGETKTNELLLPGQTPEEVMAAAKVRQTRIEALGQRFIRFGMDDVHNSFILAGRLGLEFDGHLTDHGLCPEALDYRRPLRRTG